MSDDGSLVLVAVDEPGLAIVTLNRPEKRNALLAMWPRLGAIFRELAARDDVRAVILTGAGGNFSAGADIAEFATMRRDATQAAAYADAGAERRSCSATSRSRSSRRSPATASAAAAASR